MIGAYEYGTRGAFAQGLWPIHGGKGRDVYG